MKVDQYLKMKYGLSEDCILVETIQEAIPDWERPYEILVLRDGARRWGKYHYPISSILPETRLVLVPCTDEEKIAATHNAVVEKWGPHKQTGLPVRWELETEERKADLRKSYHNGRRFSYNEETGRRLVIRSWSGSMFVNEPDFSAILRPKEFQLVNELRA